MLNNSVIMGRLVAQPELRKTESGVSVTSFAVAVDRRFNKQGEEKQADFIDIVAWRNTAEFVCKYFSKGQMIAVQGYIQTRLYEDKDGNKRKAVEIVADNVSFCGSKKADTSAPSVDVPPPSDEDCPPAESGYRDIPDDEDLPF